jgi:hypothetical protein
MAPKRVILELTPYSVQLAILEGRQLIACGEYASEAKEALAEFLASHAAKTADCVLLTPKRQFARRETGIAISRTPADLLALAPRFAGEMAMPLAVVACDASTGQPVDAEGQAPFLLAGTAAEELTSAKERLSALGLTSGYLGLALPSHLGAVVGALQDMPESTRVAVLILGENASVLALVSAAGVEALEAVPVGYTQIFEAVQAELGLKFRAAAAKLFFNDTYEFGEVAAKIAGRIAGALRSGLEGLGAPATALHTLGLPVRQAWFAQAVAGTVELATWQPDMAAVCAQRGLTLGSNCDAPGASLLGMLHLAGAEGATPWRTEWLDAAAKPVATKPAAPVRATAPAVASAQQAPKPLPPKAKPVAAKPPVAAAPVRPPAPASVAKSADVKSGASASTARPPAPAAAVQNPVAAEKRGWIPYVAGAVLVGVLGAGVKLVMSDHSSSVPVAEKTAVVAPVAVAPKPVINPIQPSTVAYYRFENGVAGATMGDESVGSVVDLTAHGYNLTAHKNPVYDGNVAVQTIPLSGAANHGSAHFDGKSADISGTAGEGLSTVVFGDFTIEAYVWFDAVEDWQSVVGRDDAAAPASEGVGLSGLFYLSRAATTAKGKVHPNCFRVELATTQHRQIEVDSDRVANPHTWYHVAAVGDTAAGTLSLYVDGVLVGQTNGFTGLFAPKANTPWTIGRAQYKKRPYDRLLGNVDEVRFSNVALTPAQFLNAAPTK